MLGLKKFEPLLFLSLYRPFWAFPSALNRIEEEYFGQVVVELSLNFEFSLIALVKFDAPGSLNPHRAVNFLSLLDHVSMVIVNPFLVEPFHFGPEPVPQIYHFPLRNAF